MKIEDQINKEQVAYKDFNILQQRRQISTIFPKGSKAQNLFVRKLNLMKINENDKKTIIECLKYHELQETKNFFQDYIQESKYNWYSIKNRYHPLLNQFNK